MRFFKLHLGLIKYLVIELKKKRTLKELIYFFKNLIKSYLKELLNLYKSLFLIFDKDYREQKKQYNKYNQIKKDLQNAIKLLNYIDNKMEKQEINRQRRRQFWRDFYSNGQIRKDIFDDLLKEIK
jgi:siroheme synthase (precorrin-2 oxidase/ferrochelatase)